MINEDSRGAYVIAATPFDEAGNLDLNSTDSLVDFYLDRGVHGLTILGMMGEAQKLNEQEAETFVARVLKRVDGRVPVIVGTSNPGLANLERLSKRSCEDGAAGVMIAPPPQLKTETQVLAYFDAVFAALGPDVPVCFQDFPTVTGVHVSVDTLNEMIARHASLVMLKHEDYPGLRKLTAVRRAAERGQTRRISILVANGGLFYPLEMRRGADGVMTGFAYPEMLVRVFELFEQGEAEAAEDLFDLHLPLLRYEFQQGPGLAIRKEVLRRRGAIRCAATRQPGPRLDADEEAELTTLMTRLERHLAARPELLGDRSAA